MFARYPSGSPEIPTPQALPYGFGYAQNDTGGWLHTYRAATKVSLPTLIKIANALDASLDELVYQNLNKCEHISNAKINALLADCTAQELSAICEVIATTKAVLRSKQ